MRLAILTAALVLAGCATLPEECHQLRPHIQSAVYAERVQVGMMPLEVRCAWGLPNDINRTTTAYGVSEQWVYEKYYGEMLGSTWRFVYFEDGIVTAVQD